MEQLEKVDIKKVISLCGEIRAKNPREKAGKKTDPVQNSSRGNARSIGQRLLTFVDVQIALKEVLGKSRVQST